ncbi:zinc finger and SCAN domain-containing protein 12-like isoform X2 [Armigeres subalbatus]|uniref:zinc finger and SCAN domain-containing protein 12-like isoform X2 n=1 Tax=Armigeres subalbatus TaxID=124917 RepID=UPI002ED699DE
MNTSRSYSSGMRSKDLCKVNSCAEFGYSSVFADMDSTVDNSPLWGATQLSYPDFNRQWTDGGDPHQQAIQCQSGGYQPYSMAPIEGNYTELRTSPEVVEADSTIAEHGGAMYHGYQHLPTGVAAGDLFPVPTEGVSYPVAESGAPGQNMSPDGGYSSGNSEYYTSYQLVPQAYAAGSPYQNVDSPPDTENVKYEVVEVKEEPDVYRNDQYFMEYVQPSVNVNQGQKSKPIIHGNVLIKPATNKQESELKRVEFEVLGVHNPMNYPLNIPLPQEHAPLNPQQQLQHSGKPIVQLKVNSTKPLAKAQTNQRKQRRSRPYPAVAFDQQPSIDLDPSDPSPKFRIPQGSPLPAYNKPEEDESEEGNARRSARPSVIECSDYKCNKCGTFFARQCGLTQHQKWIHAERKFQCERCGKKFPSQDDLTKHIKRHDMQDKPFKCLLCPKQFCHKNDLRRHMYRHEESTPYKCDLCPKCFIRKDHLLAHQLSHDRRDKKCIDKENGILF